MILQALCEGGWSQPKDEPESDPDTDKKTDDDEFDADRSENKMVQNILSIANVSDSPALYQVL